MCALDDSLGSTLSVPVRRWGPLPRCLAFLLSRAPAWLQLHACAVTSTHLIGPKKLYIRYVTRYYITHNALYCPALPTSNYLRRRTLEVSACTCMNERRLDESGLGFFFGGGVDLCEVSGMIQ